MWRPDPEARPWLALIAVLYAVAAIRLPGYLHPDEHFQTLEWARYALGYVPAEQLPWEFEARIRPWLQPALYALIGHLPGLHDGFSFALACRLLTAGLAWTGVAMLGARFKQWFPDPRLRRIAWAASATFYLLPVLRVRTSSESLGAALFMMGLAVLTRPRTEATTRRWDLLGGLALGLAFSTRYQLGFMILGLVGWQLLVAQHRRALLRSLIGAAAGVAAGLIADRWGYGEWQLTPWRYAYENLAMGRAASFGVHPLSAYIGFIWHDLALPFNLIALLALPLALWRSARHPLVWVNLPFVLGHSLVGHKELRFLFPYLFFVPVLAVLATGPWLQTAPRRVLRPLLAILAALNLWWLALDRHPNLSAGPELRALTAQELPVHHGNRDPFGRDGLHTWLFAPHTHSTSKSALKAASSTTAELYYLYQRTPSALPEPLEQACERLYLRPWPWRVFPQAWLTHKNGRRIFFTHERHAVYLCPGS